MKLSEDGAGHLVLCNLRELEIPARHEILTVDASMFVSQESPSLTTDSGFNACRTGERQVMAA